MKNTTVLEGKIVSRDTLRLTPGGVAALSVVLNHQSMQAEMEQEVQVDVEMNAIAFGDVAKQLDCVKVDDIISVKGFLSRKNRFSQQPILHITQFKIS